MKNSHRKATFWEADVVIVGGGPAGLACAYETARTGLHTLLMDKKAVLTKVYEGIVGVIHDTSMPFTFDGRSLELCTALNLDITNLLTNTVDELVVVAGDNPTSFRSRVPIQTYMRYMHLIRYDSY